MQRSGYMPSHCIGYALAVFAWLRDERSPRWTQHLRLDASEPLTKGLRYLRRSGDCYLTHENLGVTRQPTTSELTQRLETGTPSARVQALWDVEKHSSGQMLEEAVAQRLRDRDSTVRGTAILTAAELEMRDATTLHELDLALGDHAYEVRVAAANALGTLLADDPKLVTDLGFALQDEVPEVSYAAAQALLNYGGRAAPAEKNILLALHEALIDCNYGMLDLLIKVLRAALPDPGQSINDYFQKRDPEFRQAAIDALYGNEDAEV